MDGMSNEIAKTTYELYERRGKVDGYDLGDWLEAEKIVVGTNLDDKSKETMKRDTIKSKSKNTIKNGKRN